MALLTAKEVAMKLGCTTRTLQNWRDAKIGPSYIQYVDKGMVHYDEDILEEWIRERAKRCAA